MSTLGVICKRVFVYFVQHTRQRLKRVPLCFPCCNRRAASAHRTTWNVSFPRVLFIGSVLLCFGEFIVHQLVSCWWMYGRDDCGLRSRTAWQECMWQNQQNLNRQKWWESEKRKPPTSLWMHSAHIHTFGANISEHGITKRAATRKKQRNRGKYVRCALN